MEIKKIKKYEITFDHVDSRIQIDGVEAYKYLPTEFILADTKEKAIEFAKSIIEDVKAMKLTNSKGEEISVMRNGHSRKEEDYTTSNSRGIYWFILSTPITIDKYGCQRSTYGLEINIKVVEVTEIN